MSSQAQLGVKALEEGRIAEAVVFLEFATKFSPDNHQTWLLLGHAYLRNQQRREATEAYRRVVDQAADPQLQSQARKALSALDGGRSPGETVTPAKVNCPDCRRLLVREDDQPLVCQCGWTERPVATATPRLQVRDIQAYCRHKSVRISLVFRGDLIVIGAAEIRIQGLGTRTYPVNPRLLFPEIEGLPVIEQSELELIMPKQDETGIFRERRAADDMTLGKLYSWEGFVEALSAFRGYDVSQQASSGSLIRVLTAHNALDLELVQDALELQESQETIGQTLLRLGISNFESMLSAVVGDHRMPRPAARPFHERVGSMLVARGVITPNQLQDALALQTTLQKPLGEILVTHVKACSPSDVQAVLKAQRPFQPPLPEADMLGEQLVMRKYLTRTDMLRALADEQSKQRVPLGEVLLNLELISDENLSTVLSWQTQKKQILQQVRHRLGDILIAQKVITSEVLTDALRQQALDPRPLGQILVSKGVCTPEQVIQAIEQQVLRRNQAASRSGGGGAESPAAALPESFPATAAPRPSDAATSARTASAGTAGRSGKPAATGQKRPGRASVPPKGKGKGKGKGRKGRSSEGPPWMVVGIVLVVLLVAGGVAARYLLSPGPGTTASSPRS